MSYIKNLVFQREHFKLDIPFMEWPDKTLSVLTGPSGSGKSSLAWALCGLHKVEKSFEWIFEEKLLHKLKAPQRGISFLFQSLELFPHMSGKENIFFPALAKKMPVKDILSRLSFLDSYLNIDSFLEKPVHKLSGGEQQRIALARSLIIPSSFLILDEPFSSLDKNRIKKVCQLLKKILDQDQNSILVISHQITELQNIADQFFYMKNGKLV